MNMTNLKRDNNYEVYDLSNNRLRAIYGGWEPKYLSQYCLVPKVFVNPEPRKLLGAKEQNVTENYTGLRLNCTTSDLNLIGLLFTLQMKE